MEVNWAEVRSEFPALAARTFLNTATFGQLPKCAVEAVASHFAPRARLAGADFRATLEEIAAFLRPGGVLLCVDGTQSVGALQLDVSSIRPDMLVVDGYKWLLAPNGAGFCYVSPELRRRLEPSVIGWRSHKDWRRPERLHHGEPVFADCAEKYEGGMLAFTTLYAMGASIEMLLEIGPGRTERRVLVLLSR